MQYFCAPNKRVFCLIEILETSSFNISRSTKTLCKLTFILYKSDTLDPQYSVGSHILFFDRDHTQTYFRFRVIFIIFVSNLKV